MLIVAPRRAILPVEGLRRHAEMPDYAMRAVADANICCRLIAAIVFRHTLRRRLRQLYSCCRCFFRRHAALRY